MLNVSILDGWWAEAYDGENGFAIGFDATHADASIQWRRDAAALYDTLERQVVPIFFDRDVHGVPERWVQIMRRSIATPAWRFSADRMVLDYAKAYYMPAIGGWTSRH